MSVINSKIEGLTGLKMLSSLSLIGNNGFEISSEKI